MKLYIPLILLILVSCAVDTSENSKHYVQFKPGVFQFEAIADMVVRRLDPQAGERIMCVGKPGGIFDTIVPMIAREIRDRDAEFLGVISVTEDQPDSWSTDFTRGAMALNADALEDYLRQCDAGIMLPGPVPSDIPYRAMQNILDTGAIRTIHFHWAGAYSIGMDVLDLTDKIHNTYQNALLKTDYKELSERQKELETAMRGVLIRVTTPAGTDISFEIGDRPVTKQDGDASASRARLALNLIDREVELPAGAVRVAPIEESVNGTIVFPPADWNGTKVVGLTLTFERGVVSDWSAAEGGEAYESELNSAGDAVRSFREIAIGLNPLLAIPKNNPWVPYYGYGAGVVRLSLGDNSELGGNVGGGYVRWNFFTDATVTIGDKVWIENGVVVYDL